MTKAFLLAAAAVTLASAVAFGCGNSSGSGSGSTLPDRTTADDGGKTTSSSSSSGGTPDSGGTATCSGSTLKTSDVPACDTCTKNKCCDQVLACDKSFDCKALGDCIGKCADNDTTCVLTCSAAHDTGTALLQDLASCAQFMCSNECAASVPDAGGFDAF